MSAEDRLALHVLEAELADVQSAQASVFLGIRRVVPGVQLVAAKQNGLNHVAALGYLTLNAQLLLQDGDNLHVSQQSDDATDTESFLELEAVLRNAARTHGQISKSRSPGLRTHEPVLS